VRVVDCDGTSAPRSISQLKDYFGRYDVLLIHTMHPLVVAALALNLSKQTFFYQHGMTGFQSSFAKAWAKRVWYSIIPRLLAKAVICSSGFAISKNRANRIQLPSRIFVIVPFGSRMVRGKSLPGGTSSELPAELVIGMAGRLVEQKRFHKAISVLDSIELSGDQSIKVLIAGSGPERDALTRLASTVSNNQITIEFLGEVEDMREFYASLDLFILPSVGESYGLVVLEALLQNVPVAVFSDVGAAAQFIENGKTGFVLTGKEDLAQRISAILSDRLALTEMKEVCRASDMTAFSAKSSRLRLEEKIGSVISSGIQV
jgi:glycosyltransferase involved in cell wall biosynthesis